MFELCVCISHVNYLCDLPLKTVVEPTKFSELAPLFNVIAFIVIVVVVAFYLFHFRKCKIFNDALNNKNNNK